MSHGLGVFPTAGSGPAASQVAVVAARGPAARRILRWRAMLVKGLPSRDRDGSSATRAVRGKPPRQSPEYA